MRMRGGSQNQREMKKKKNPLLDRASNPGSLACHKILLASGINDDSLIYYFSPEEVRANPDDGLTVSNTSDGEPVKY